MMLHYGPTSQVYGLMCNTYLNIRFPTQKGKYSQQTALDERRDSELCAHTCTDR